jgi:hypothetical protein
MLAMIPVFDIVADLDPKHIVNKKQELNVDMLMLLVVVDYNNKYDELD